MIYLLIFGGFLKLLGLAHACPEDVPLGAVWRHNSDSSSFHCIDYRVINVGRFVNLEAQSHVFIHHTELMDGFNLLKWTRFNIFSSIPVFQEGLRNSDLEAILGVREVDSQLL